MSSAPGVVVLVCMCREKMARPAASCVVINRWILRRGLLETPSLGIGSSGGSTGVDSDGDSGDAVEGSPAVEVVDGPLGFGASAVAGEEVESLSARAVEDESTYRLDGARILQAGPSMLH